MRGNEQTDALGFEYVCDIQNTFQQLWYWSREGESVRGRADLMSGI
jgi:hypothetical protein